VKQSGGTIVRVCNADVSNVAEKEKECPPERIPKLVGWDEERTKRGKRYGRER